LKDTLYVMKLLSQGEHCLAGQDFSFFIHDPHQPKPADGTCKLSKKKALVSFQCSCPLF